MSRVKFVAVIAMTTGFLALLGMTPTRFFALIAVTTEIPPVARNDNRVAWNDNRVDRNDNSRVLDLTNNPYLQRANPLPDRSPC